MCEPPSIYGLCLRGDSEMGRRLLFRIEKGEIEVFFSWWDHHYNAPHSTTVFRTRSVPELQAFLDGAYTGGILPTLHEKSKWDNP